MKAALLQGFTLVELMVTITVLAILVVLGVPSYQQWIRNTGVRNAAESIQNGLRLARNEASQRGTNVRFEFTSAGTADWTVCQLPAAATVCGAGVPIQTFVSKGGASAVQINTAVAVGTITTPLTTAVAAGSGITFSALGRPSDYGVTSLARIDANSTMGGTRWLVTTISAGGSVRMCDPKIAFSANAPQGCM
ncbi:MAG: GspH/FimT family pseudopilin [Pseudoxanthomonas sp.]